MRRPIALPPIRVMCREDAERYEAPRGSVCISITSPGGPGAHLLAFEDILRLRFDDATNGFTPANGVGMSHTQALAILEFVERYRDRAPEIMIHCGAGASRSPSVAAAIRHVYGYPVGVREVVNFSVYGTIVRAASATRAGVFGRRHRVRKIFPNG